MLALDAKRWTSQVGRQALDLTGWTPSGGRQALDLKVGRQAVDAKRWTSRLDAKRWTPRVGPQGWTPSGGRQGWTPSGGRHAVDAKRCQALDSTMRSWHQGVSDDKPEQSHQHNGSCSQTAITLGAALRRICPGIDDGKYGVCIQSIGMTMMGSGNSQ